VWDTWDLLTDQVELDRPNDADDKLLTALCKEIGDDEWCEIDPYGMRVDERLLWSWQSFCEYIKHQRRYFFLRPTKKTRPSPYTDQELLEPAEILREIAEGCRETGLFTRLPAGEKLWRSRHQPPGKTYDTAKDVGPPPKEYAVQANRMSAPGISICYGALDQDTAIVEVKRGRKKTYAVGEFELCCPIWALDLARLPPVPNLFCESDEQAARRPLLCFLRDFVRDLTKPIARDNRIHVEYVPTQVVTEYFRTEVEHEGESVRAVLYPSAKRKSKRCIAVFAGSEEVSDGICVTSPKMALLALKVVSATIR
jgi:hypothetical protein